MLWSRKSAGRWGRGETETLCKAIFTEKYFLEMSDRLGKLKKRSNTVPLLSLKITSSEASAEYPVSTSNLYRHTEFLPFLALVEIWKFFICWFVNSQAFPPYCEAPQRQGPGLRSSLCPPHLERRPPAWSRDWKNANCTARILNT